MDFITIALIAFTVLEILNIMILYFAPDSKKGNGVAVFNAWHESKENRDLHQFIKYLVYWVAGSKLIFIALLGIIIVFGDTMIKTISVVALIITISTFYWKLYPLIRSLDQNQKITPSGYSLILGKMIFGFIFVFLMVLMYHFI